MQLALLNLKVESNAVALILTIIACLSKDLVIEITGSRCSLFGTFKLGTTLSENWLNISQNSSSLDDDELLCWMTNLLKGF